MRIEDLDPQRSRPEFEESQLADLRALGIDWDEQPVRQSERTWLYDDALGQAARASDGCTRASAPAPRSARPPRPRTASCPRASIPAPAATSLPLERRRRIEAGERFALRLRADAERIEFDDCLLGPSRLSVDDFVVVRSDGVHAYQLAVVVDDAAQGIGEVVRGADLADSTPRQILLQRLLGLPTPSYAHVPLVLGPSGERLAKRDRAATLGRPRRAGGGDAGAAGPQPRSRRRTRPSAVGLRAACGVRLQSHSPPADNS